MSQRTRNSIPLPAPHRISDKSRLLWERYYNPMQQAAAGLNAAIQNVENVIGSIIIEAEGFSPETHVFNPQNGTVIQRPKPKGENGGKVVE